MPRYTSKISIIGIGYNAEKYLDRYLQSIENIKDDNFEFIFVDDGSQDNTQKIALSYQNRISGYKYIRIDNSGIVAARKTGLSKATGEYVLMTDSDDFLEDRILEVMRGLLKKYQEKNPDIIATNTWIQDADNKFRVRKQSCKNGVYINDEYLTTIFTSEMYHYMFSKLYKRQFMIDSGYLSYPEITMAEDWMTQIFFGTQMPVVIYEDTPTYHYCNNTSSLSKSENKKIFEQEKTIKYIEQYFKEKNLYDKYKDYITLLWFDYALGYVLMPFSDDFKKKLFNICRSKIRNYSDTSVCNVEYKKLGIAGKILFQAYYHEVRVTRLLNKSYILLKRIMNKIRQEIRR